MPNGLDHSGVSKPLLKGKERAADAHSRARVGHQAWLGGVGFLFPSSCASQLPVPLRCIHCRGPCAGRVHAEQGISMRQIVAHYRQEAWGLGGSSPG